MTKIFNRVKLLNEDFCFLINEKGEIIMNKRTSLKIVKGLVKENVKPLNFKSKSTYPDKIIKIRTDTMRVHGIPPIKTTKKEYRKMHNKEIKRRIKRFRKELSSLQKKINSAKNIRSNIKFG